MNPGQSGKHGFGGQGSHNKIALPRLFEKSFLLDLVGQILMCLFVRGTTTLTDLSRN